MSKTISVMINEYVDVNLADIDSDDLEEELLNRATKGRKPVTPSRSAAELSNLIERYHRETCKRLTAHPGSVTETEREFWTHVHGRDV